MIGVILYGQLGNQMFQYTAARYLADSLDTSVLSVGPRSSWRGTFLRLLGSKDESKYPDAGQHNGVLEKALGHGASELKMRVSGKIRTVIEKTMFDQIYEPSFETTDSGAFIEYFSSDFHTQSDRTLLSGWLQSSKYWNADRAFARRLYAPSPIVYRVRDELERNAGVDFDTAIAMHIRRGDYLDMRHGLSEIDSGWALPQSYYAAALEAFPEDQKVLVFSDDPEWAEQNFSGSRFYVQPKRAAEVDLFLLSMCKHKIIANSSFSWWGAYLGDQTGITIAPKFHLGWRLEKWAPNDIEEPEWKYLDVLALDRAAQAGIAPIISDDPKHRVSNSGPAITGERTKPPVSILIPCFNAEEWVGQAIESSLSQKADIEVVVYDDGSTDGSAKIIKGFGDKVTFIGGENKGAPTARNALLERAKYDWVQYLDADDYLLPQKIDQQLDALLDHPDIDVIYGPVWIEWRDRNDASVASDLDRSPIPEPRDPWRLLALWQLPQTGGAIWRKSAIIDVGRWTVDQPCCQEHELYFRMLKQGKKFLYAPHGGAVYRRFETGTVSTKNMALVRSERSKIERNIEAHLAASNMLTPDRRWAVNQARFQMARSAWPLDRSEARRLHAEIVESMPDFRPTSPSAPRNYQRLYSILGFELTEKMAGMARTVGKIVRR